MTNDADEPTEDPAIRHAKTILFRATMIVLLVVIVVLLSLQPEDQVRVTRHPNGYPRTETHFVLNAGGVPVEHGAHRAWHPDGTRAEEGRFETGQRAGEWRFWDASGRLDGERSGVYVAGERTGGLEER